LQEDESIGAAYHACGLQFSRDPSRGITRMQKHKRLGRRCYRLRQGPSQPSPASEGGDQKKYENEAHLRDSLDEGAPPVVGHWSLAFSP
jgi:hypothetical protein